MDRFVLVVKKQTRRVAKMKLEGYKVLDENFDIVQTIKNVKIVFSVCRKGMISI